MVERDPGAWTSGDSKPRLGIVVWSLIWVVSFLAADVALESGWIEGDPLAILVVAAVTLLGIAWVLSYRRFLQSADELIRKIHMDALAWTVGAGFVTAFTYSLLESAHLGTESPAVVIPVVMTVAYATAALLGYRRFS